MVIWHFRRITRMSLAAWGGARWGEVGRRGRVCPRIRIRHSYCSPRCAFHTRGWLIFCWNLFLCVAPAFSLLLTPLPSGNHLFPVTDTSVLFWVFVFCFVMFGHLLCFLDSTFKWNHTVFVFSPSDLTSRSIVPCRPIHVVTDGKMSFFWWPSAFCCACLQHLHHSSVHRHLGWPHILAVVNSAVMNVEVQISL